MCVSSEGVVSQPDEGDRDPDVGTGYEPRTPSSLGLGSSLGRGEERLRVVADARYGTVVV